MSHPSSPINQTVRLMTEDKLAFKDDVRPTHVRLESASGAGVLVTLEEIDDLVAHANREADHRNPDVRALVDLIMSKFGNIALSASPLPPKEAGSKEGQRRGENKAGAR